MGDKKKSKEEPVEKVFRFGERCGIEVAIELLHSTLVDIHKAMDELETEEERLAIGQAGLLLINRIESLNTLLEHLKEERCS